MLTSGSGGAFPQGLVIGRVVELRTDSDGRIEYGVVEPQVEFDTLVQVFVIKDYKVVE